MKNFIADNNNVSTSARGAIVTGKDNFVGYACKNITLSSCVRCSVLPRLENVTLINCSDLIVTTSNVCYVNNVIKSEEQIQTTRISLTSAQIKTLNSVPIEILPAQSGKAIEVISAIVNWNGGTTPFFSLTYLSLIIDTATNGLFPTISDYSTSHFVPFVYDQSVGYDLIENKGLLITADADSANGNGNCDIYINYKIITL